MTVAAGPQLQIDYVTKCDWQSNLKYTLTDWQADKLHDVQSEMREKYQAGLLT